MYDDMLAAVMPGPGRPVVGRPDSDESAMDGMCDNHAMCRWGEKDSLAQGGADTDPWPGRVGDHGARPQGRSDDYRDVTGSGDRRE